MEIQAEKTFKWLVMTVRHAYQAHEYFCYALSIIIPLEFIFVLSNNYMWGIFESKFAHIVTKPIPMLFIIGAAVISAKIYGVNRYRTFFILGFVLSLIADVILLGDSDEFFLGGLAIFLLAHVMYIIGFSIPQDKQSPSIPWHYNRLWMFFTLMIVPAILTSKMVSENTNIVLIVAVMIYSLVIGTMGWRAAARIGYSSENSFSQWVAFIGSLFFIVSDSVLAFNKFYAPVPYEKIIVLNTYWIAQTLFAIAMQRDPWHKLVQEVPSVAQLSTVGL